MTVADAALPKQQHDANIDTIFTRTADDIARYYASFIAPANRESMIRCIQNGDAIKAPSNIRDKCAITVKMMAKILDWKDGTASEHIKSLMKRRNLVARQHLFVLRIWLMCQLRIDKKENFNFTVFPRPFGPLQPPITLSVEHSASISIFTNFKNLLAYYARNVKNPLPNDSKFLLSLTLANLVENAPQNADGRKRFFEDCVSKIAEKLALLKPKKKEQLSHKQKQELSAFVNFTYA